MINSALLCVFATCAIFLVNPSTGGPLVVERAAVNNDVESSGKTYSKDFHNIQHLFNGQLSKSKLPPLIDVNHHQHPNQICQRDANPGSAVLWLMMMEAENFTDPTVSCSDNIVCYSRDEKDEVLVMDESPMEGSECKPFFESESYRYMCIQGQCVRVDGLFPNAPTDQDEAKSDSLIANDYPEIEDNSIGRMTNWFEP